MYWIIWSLGSGFYSSCWIKFWIKVGGGWELTLVGEVFFIGRENCALWPIDLTSIESALGFFPDLESFLFWSLERWVDCVGLVLADFFTEIYDTLIFLIAFLAKMVF